MTAVPFAYNVICQVCRKKIKSFEAVKRWDGYIVGRNHEGCYETKHPLDMPLPPRAPENRPLPFTSPESTDVYQLSGTTSSITVTSSPFTYTAGITREQITITGGTVEKVRIDEATAPSTSGSFLVLPGARVEVTYSSAPTMTKLVT